MSASLRARSRRTGRGHRAGQHTDVRLTAEDGYQAQRSYSVASAPEDGELVLTVERLEDGEVSPYLTDQIRPGDELELRGPIGGFLRFGGADPWRPAAADRRGSRWCRSARCSATGPPATVRSRRGSSTRPAR